MTLPYHSDVKLKLQINLPFYYTMDRKTLLLSFVPLMVKLKYKYLCKSSNRLLSLLDLKRVEKLEITSDKTERTSVLLTIDNEDSQQMIEIYFKPYFKQIFKEQLT
jgi:hypothetical protein